MNIKSTIETLLKDGFILVFNQDKLDVVKTAEALMKAGINNMEVTCRIKMPLEKMSRLRKELPDFAMGSASLIDSPQMLELYNKTHPEDPLPSVTPKEQTSARYSRPSSLGVLPSSRPSTRLFIRPSAWCRRAEPTPAISPTTSILELWSWAARSV